MKCLRTLLTTLCIWVGLSVLTLALAGTATFTNSGTWTAPAGVTSVTVDAWGGGGAGGGQNQNSDGGGGGGGGAYSRSASVAVIPGNTYTVTVGAGGVAVVSGTGGAGGDSFFISTSTVLAKGGAGGAPSTGTPPPGGLGGAAASGVGTTKFSGGNGGKGRNNNTGQGGPGGSSAGTTGDGTSGPATWSTITAAAPPTGGGIGGNGGNANADGAAPASGYGGGGGGSGDGSAKRGGAGAPGVVVLSYIGQSAVASAPATSIAATSATLNGSVTSDSDASTTVTFDYGLTLAYGSTTAATPSPVAAGATNAVSAAITGLTANTLYHFRVNGSNSAGTANGADRTFTTLPPPPPSLTKTASSASATVGDVMTFTIVLDNPTAAALTNVTVGDVLPAGMVYGTHVASLGTLAVAGQTLTWSIPSVPAGGSATLTLAVSLTQQGVLTNTATSSGITSSSASILVLSSALTHFRLDEPVGSWTGAAGEVIDSGTTGLHGTRLTTSTPTTTNEVAPSPTIAAQYPAVVGGFCNAGRFDGNGVIQVADSPLFDYTKTLSATVWIYPTAYNTEMSSILSNDVNYEFHLNPAGKLYWWWNASTLTSASTIPLNQWTHIAITFDSAAGRQRIYINGVQDSNTNNWTGTLQPNPCNFIIGGDVATGTCALIPGRNFRGMIDEVKLYEKALDAAEVQADMTLGRSCSGTYDHIQIEHAGTGSICTPETVTVKACLNASCSTLYPGAVTVQLSPTGWIGGGTFTFSGGIASRQLSVGSAGNVTLGTVSASPLPAGAARCFIGSTESCTMNFINASCSFNAVEPAGTPQARIFTKLAGTTFNLDLLALSNSTTINTGYTGTVAVDLVDASGSACPSGSGLNTVANIPFVSGDSGRKQVIFTYPQAAGNVRVRMKAGSSAAACSTDNFAIRPQQFAVTAPALSNATLTGAPNAVAGSAFTLTANAGVTAGYTGTPVLNPSKVNDHQSIAIAANTLSGTFLPGTGPSASGAAFKYLDVGNIKLLADAVLDTGFTSVDQVGDCVVGSTSNTAVAGKYGCNIGSAASATLGRWYPSHYSFAGTLTPACGPGGFSYMDQDALGVNLVLKAHASTGGAASAADPVVSRYTAGYTNLAPVTITGDNGGAAVALTRLANPTLPSMPNTNLWSAGVFQISDTYAFGKLANPDGPYDLFKLKAALADPDGSSLLTAPTPETNTSKMRYGRIQLQNAYGSELLSLPVPLAIQYWNGNWQTNSLDTCTSIQASQFAWSFPAGSAPHPNNLAACETAATVSGVGPNYTVTLNTPGASNAGWADLTLNVGAAAVGSTCTAVNAGTGFTAAATTANAPWLQFNWTGTVANPQSRANFGIYKNPLIYRRENY